MLWRDTDLYAVEYVVGTQDCVAEIQTIKVKVPKSTRDKAGYIRSSIANGIQIDENYVHIYHAIGIKE